MQRRFRVKEIDRSGMMPYLFQVDWFYAVCALGVVTTAAGAYLLRIQSSKMQREESSRLMEERLELLELRTRELEDVNQKLQRLSYLDGLTGIANRRHFEEALDREWRRACRVGGAVSLIMVDTDSFKAFNDTYGHQRGDECLMMVAATLRESLRRPGDLVARYGGEEFMIILPGTDAKGSAELAETIRARVEAMDIAHEGSRVNPVVTISLGVVTGYPMSGSLPDALVAAADTALYQAKEEGRNRVVSREEVSQRVQEESAPAF